MMNKNMEIERDITDILHGLSPISVISARRRVEVGSLFKQSWVALCAVVWKLLLLSFVKGALWKIQSCLRLLKLNQNVMLELDYFNLPPLHLSSCTKWWTERRDREWGQQNRAGSQPLLSPPHRLFPELKTQLQDLCRQLHGPHSNYIRLQSNTKHWWLEILLDFKIIKCSYQNSAVRVSELLGDVEGHGQAISGVYTLQGVQWRLVIRAARGWTTWVVIFLHCLR